MSRDEVIANHRHHRQVPAAAKIDAEDWPRIPPPNKKKSDVSLIGQFGVGFYAVFMVAESVSVTSRRAGAQQAWRWTSDGLSGFEVSEAPADTPRGTSIELKLKKDAKEFSESFRVESVIKSYSSHIGLPVWVAEGGTSRQVNEAAALWTRPKSQIKPDEYTEFYRHISHAFDEPWLTVHNRAEGRISYTNLLFVPSMAPFDLFDPQRRHGVKLYVRKVFITDNCEGLVPTWLRFLKGVVDSEDLPLNVSREVLQANPVVERISKALVKRVLGELKKKADKDSEAYATFWETYGAVLKEGIYEDWERREELLKLCRFRSTQGRRLGQPRRLCRAHEGGPGQDLSADRREDREHPRQPDAGGPSGPGASRSCCWTIRSTSSGPCRPTPTRTSSSSMSAAAKSTCRASRHKTARTPQGRRRRSLPAIPLRSWRCSSWPSTSRSRMSASRRA